MDVLACSWPLLDAFWDHLSLSHHTKMHLSRNYIISSVCTVGVGAHYHSGYCHSTHVYVQASLGPTHCTAVQPLVIPDQARRPPTYCTWRARLYVVLLPSGERQRVKRGQWSRSECTVQLQSFHFYQARQLLLLLHHGSYYCWSTCYLTLLHAYTQGMSYALCACLVLRVLYPHWSSTECYLLVKHSHYLVQHGTTWFCGKPLCG